MVVNEPAFFDAPEMRRFAQASAQVLARCEELAAITDEPDRITRTFLSPATMNAQALVKQWMEAAGLSVRVDGAANVIGRREGNAKGPEKTLAIGSHLDTVPNAGKYDGILGVIAGIALAELTRNEPLPFALEIVAFSEEEGVRFAKPYIGSHAYAGTLNPEWLDLRDKAGVTVREAIHHVGLNPAPLETLHPRNDLLAFLELHIEQGPVLDARHLPLAIVSAIAGQSRLLLEFTGHAGHAGTTPMDLRSDALVAAATFVVAVEDASKSQPELVATVGRLDVFPNASNVIPGTVQFSLDVRHAHDAVRLQIIETLLAKANAIATNRKATFRIVSRADFPAVPMSPSLIQTLAAAAKNYTVPALVSGAGHDASVLAAIAPAAMLFIRSPAGISHNPAESVIPSDVTLALHVLHTAIHSLHSPD